MSSHQAIVQRTAISFDAKTASGAALRSPMTRAVMVPPPKAAWGWEEGGGEKGEVGESEFFFKSFSFSPFSRAPFQKRNISFIYQKAYPVAVHEVALQVREPGRDREAVAGELAVFFFFLRLRSGLKDQTATSSFLLSFLFRSIPKKKKHSRGTETADCR